MLSARGVVLEETLTGRRTIARVPLTASLEADSVYDLAVVAVRRVAFGAHAHAARAEMAALVLDIRMLVRSTGRRTPTFDALWDATQVPAPARGYRTPGRTATGE
jgi:hypothetical protein